MNNFKFSSSSMARMEGIDPQLMRVAHRALQISKIDFGIPQHGGKRTAKQQNELFRAEKSQLDGYEKLSYHQSGKALDVYAYVDGRASWDEKHLTHVAAAMLAAANELGVNLQWGGHWSQFIDMPHFQIEG